MYEQEEFNIEKEKASKIMYKINKFFLKPFPSIVHFN